MLCRLRCVDVVCTFTCITIHNFTYIGGQVQWHRQGGGGGAHGARAPPFYLRLYKKHEEVYLKDPAEHGATSVVSGHSEVVACLPVS